ncbi:MULTISPECIES: MarC family protein [unclassified Asticcacaulis]|uniref:MarC family protein n=1 Tax=unclassified Asticcacaulis TaxID=2628350 RepID=UPI0004CE04D8|nr:MULTISPECIES: MarC family protein [unclassified Asticcacaulis]MDV6331489.1 MarC family protein [Asticcacaulis sp. 201]
MTLVEFYVNFFITLFALIDPIGNVPIYAAATQSQTSTSRRWLSIYISIFTALILTIFFFAGLSILKFFGISMDAFRIAGGLLLFLMGLEMARGDFIDSFTQAEDVKHGGDPTTGVQPLGHREKAKNAFEKLVVPFAFPLMVGPGTISTVIIQAGEAQKLGYIGLATGVAAIFTTGAAVLVTLLFSNTISRVFGRVGMVVVVRVLGLILCALSVQIIISAVSEITHNLILPSAAHPYESGKHS